MHWVINSCILFYVLVAQTFGSQIYSQVGGFQVGFPPTLPVVFLSYISCCIIFLCALRTSTNQKKIWFMVVCALEGETSCFMHCRSRLERHLNVLQSTSTSWQSLWAERSLQDHLSLGLCWAGWLESGSSAEPQLMLQRELSVQNQLSCGLPTMQKWTGEVFKCLHTPLQPPQHESLAAGSCFVWFWRGRD